MKKEISTSALMKLTIGGLVFLLFLALVVIQNDELSLHHATALIQSMQKIDLERITLKNNFFNVVSSSNSPNDNFFHTETVLTDNNLITVTTKWKEWWGKEYEIVLVDKYIP